MSGFLSLAAKLLNNTLFDLIGNILIAVGAVIGLGIGFYAMFKYNKGIF